MRRTMAAALVALSCIAAPAQAGPSCRMLVDPQGDGELLRRSGYPATHNDPALDIVSADVVADSRYVTAVARVLGLSQAGPDSLPGVEYRLQFWLDGRYRRGFLVTAWRDAYGRSGGAVKALYGTLSEEVGAPRVTWDQRAGEVRMTMSRAELNHYLPIGPDRVVTSMELFSYVLYETPGTAPEGVSDGHLVVGADEAASTRRYRMGSPSCVRPGS